MDRFHLAFAWTLWIALTLLPPARAAAFDTEDAEDRPNREHMRVKGQRYTWFETPQTASEGRVEQQQLKERPILRPGEIMEAVPGLVTTQHSGTGKANQYFLRGFNLDHGTDFATLVDGVPINMPTHAHGQGYNDVNFLIPETLASIDYSKGPYSAKVGNFSGAGSVSMETADRFEKTTIQYTGGSFGYGRALALGTLDLTAHSELSYAVEGTRYTGPWSDVHEHLRKGVGLLKYVWRSDQGTLRLNHLYYQGAWNATNQIPERAVKQEQISRFGAIEKTDGGESRRQSLAASWEAGDEKQDWKIEVYGVKYALNLWSNPSYFLADPIGGDQFEQADRRTILGGQLQVRDTWQLGNIPLKISAGIQQRSDFIKQLGLYQTQNRIREETSGEARAQVLHTGFFVQQEWMWSTRLRSTFGLRHDVFSYELEDLLADARGEKKAVINSPKAGMAVQASDNLSLFANIGQSFHSNDARGVVDFPASAGKGERAPALVPARGYELGANYQAGQLLRFSLALWQLKLDSELIFVGDAGSTEPSRASLRQGIDSLLQIYPSQRVHLDLEASWAQARFTSDPEQEGRQVEGALPFVGSAGIGSQLSPNWSTVLRLRHFGRRPLTADGSQRSKPTQLVNLRLAYAMSSWEWTVDLLNVLNSKDHDITYFYESRLQSEAEPVADVHYHPVEPAMIRSSLAYRF